MTSVDIETDVKHVLLKVTVLERGLADITSPAHAHRHLVDMSGQQVDTDAQGLLARLKDVKVMDALSPGDVIKVTS